MDICAQGFRAGGRDQGFPIALDLRAHAFGKVCVLAEIDSPPPERNAPAGFLSEMFHVKQKTPEPMWDAGARNAVNIPNSAFQIPN